jgi:Streptomycin adenylyltransferase
MKPPLESYRDGRDHFFLSIVDSISRDERFVAAWLTGSFSRNEADFLSDIDITLVVSDQFSSSLCTRLEQVSAQTSLERYSLFSQFGAPALIHENNNNAPEGGTFTFVLYAESAFMVDWILIPHSNAKRPSASKLLFDKVGIPIEHPTELEDLEQRKKSVVEQWVFFWMMTAVTIKHIIRGDGVFAAQWIENLHSIVLEIERKINGEPWSYKRGSLSQLQETTEKQLESLKQLCRKMQSIQSDVIEFTGSVVLLPWDEIEILFSFVNT